MWAECVVGAVEEERYLAMLEAAGFEGVERLGELDYFALSSSDTTREVAGLFTAHSVTLRATKPQRAAQALPASPTRRAFVKFASEMGGVAVAVLAWLTCAGIPALVSALGAVGAYRFTDHAYMIPAYAAFLGLSVWLLWRSGRARGRLEPFWVGLAGGVFAVVTTWLAVTGIATRLAWWSYGGVAAVVAASIWSFTLGRQPGACLEEMRYEARRREEKRSPVQQFAVAAIALVAVAATLYGLYYTVEESAFW